MRQNKATIQLLDYREKLFMYQLAQLNIAELKKPIDSPELSDFVNNLDRINQLAETSAGFVWRYETNEEEAITDEVFGGNYIVNLSVWSDITSLHNYIYRSAHVEIMKRRKEWFHRMKEAYTVLWWVSSAHIPTTLEAKERLDSLHQNGPSQNSFTFKNPYSSPDSISESQSGAYDDTCPVI
jgi:hypothetical protein